MCHDKDYKSTITTTGSSNLAHGVCCKPDYTGEHCNNDGDHVCSEPSLIEDSSSKWAEILNPENRNMQMYAFCPGINQQVCGISDDSTNTDMTITAGIDKKTFSSTALAYNEGTSTTRKHSFCYYNIKAELSEEELAGLEQDKKDGIKV